MSHTIDNVDVFSITNDEKVAYVNYIHVSNGSINQSFTFEYKKRLNETEQELLQLGIIEMRERFNSHSKEIVVPFEPDMELENVVFTVPQRGDKKTLLDLSLMNGKQYKFDRLKQAEKLNPEQKQVRLTPDEGVTGEARLTQTTLSDRVLRQLEHLRYRCRGCLRGLQEYEAQ